MIQNDWRQGSEGRHFLLNVKEDLPKETFKTETSGIHVSEVSQKEKDEHLI